MSSGNLFPRESKSRFLVITADRYRNMCVRLEKKRLPPPPFTLAQLRDHILDAMGWSHSGAIKCKYCGKVCDISEVALDHAVPIARGGALGLDNIEMPCARCNAAKGEATSAEWTLVMSFLEEKVPRARVDILDRLALYGKLLAGKRKADMLLRNQGQFPAKKKPRAAEKPPIISAIDENF